MNLSTTPFYIKPIPCKSKLNDKKIRIHSRKYQCALCGKVSKQSGNLDTHIKLKHLDSKKYHCPFQNCNKKFSVLWALRSHYISKHSNSKKFKCFFSGCNKSFNQKYQRDIHYNSIHCDMWYFCDCGKKFANQYALKYHKQKCLV